MTYLHTKFYSGLVTTYNFESHTDFLQGHFVIKFCKKKIPQRRLKIFQRYFTTTHNFRTLA